MTTENEPDAMTCWHFIAPIIPVNSSQFSMDVYIKTFHAFQLLEREEKEKQNDQRK